MAVEIEAGPETQRQSMTAQGVMTTLNGYGSQSPCFCEVGGIMYPIHGIYNQGGSVIFACTLEETQETSGS